VNFVGDMKNEKRKKREKKKVEREKKESVFDLFVGGSRGGVGKHKVNAVWLQSSHLLGSSI